MDKDKAILVLEEQRMRASKLSYFAREIGKEIESTTYAKVAEALEMAIEALEKQG